MSIINKHYLGSIFSLGTATVLQMGVILILAKELGAANFGRYSIYASSMAIFVEICGLGGGDYFIKHARSGHRNIMQLAGYCATYGLLAAFLLTPVLAFTINCLDVTKVAPLFVMALFFELLSNRYQLFIEYFYIGLNKSSAANACKMAFNGVRFVGAILFFYILTIDKNLADWIYFQSILSTSSVIIIIILYIKGRGICFPYIERAMILESIPFGVTQVLRTVQQNMDRLLLGLILPMDVLGAYSAASRFTTASLTPTVALLRSTVAGFYDTALKGRESLNAFTRKVVLRAMLVTSATSVMLIVGLFAVEYLLGSSYQNIPRIGMALIPSIYLTVLLYIAGDYYNGISLSHTRMNFTIISIIVYVMMTYALGLSFGLPGIIVSITITGLLTLMLYVGYLWGTKQHRQARQQAGDRARD